MYEFEGVGAQFSPKNKHEKKLNHISFYILVKYYFMFLTYQVGKILKVKMWGKAGHSGTYLYTQ